MSRILVTVTFLVVTPRGLHQDSFLKDQDKRYITGVPDHHLRKGSLPCYCEKMMILWNGVTKISWHSVKPLLPSFGITGWARCFTLRGASWPVLQHMFKKKGQKMLTFPAHHAGLLKGFRRPLDFYNPRESLDAGI